MRVARSLLFLTTVGGWGVDIKSDLWICCTHLEALLMKNENKENIILICSSSLGHCLRDQVLGTAFPSPT